MQSENSSVTRFMFSLKITKSQMKNPSVSCKLKVSHLSSASFVFCPVASIKNNCY